MSRGVLRTAVVWGGSFACVASVQTIDVAGQDRLQQLDERIARVEAQLRDLLAEVETLRKERD